jgi:hypothetical protein
VRCQQLLSPSSPTRDRETVCAGLNLDRRYLRASRRIIRDLAGHPIVNPPDWSVFVVREVQPFAFLQRCTHRKDVCPATQNLERHTAQHRRAVDLEAATLVDQPVRGPLSYYTAVVEVVGECGLR